MNLGYLGRTWAETAQWPAQQASRGFFTHKRVTWAFPHTYTRADCRAHRCVSPNAQFAQMEEARLLILRDALAASAAVRVSSHRTPL